MTEDHERIEELLAGHAIGALEGEDRAEADRLLTDHVPTCITCRTALEESFMVSADLALAAPPVEPPELLWRQLRREVLAPPAPRRRRSILTWSSAITAAAAVLGLAVWNTTLNSRISDEARTQRQVSTAFAALADPTAKKIRLDSSTEPSSLAGAYTRQAHLTIIGVDIPNPAPGHTYRVWFVGRSGNLRARDFRPADGLVILNLSVDPTRFTELVITEELVGRAGTGPAGIPRWTTRL
jgi:anti-sigma-K factor RskA